MLRIYEHIKWAQDYRVQDYNVLWFKKVRTFENWELKTVLYNDTNWDTVVREDIVYNRDENDYIYERVKTITWIKTDWTVHNDVKITYKDYSPREATRAWERKRQNQITDLKITTIWLIQQTEWNTKDEATSLWIDMILEVDSEINKYILWAKQPLIDAINADTDCLWLDNDIWDWTTIRQYLVSELSK